MRISLIFGLAIVGVAIVFFAFQTKKTPFKSLVEKRIYDFSVKDLQGNTFDFSTLKGKKILIVNTASRCGYTHQYEGLEKLYKTYKDKGLVVVGFPCNQFGRQEPGTNQEIATFCQSKYGVTFPMMEKVKVKGKGQHPIYQFLTHKAHNGVLDAKVSWNFNKFLIDSNGHLVKHLSSRVKPMSEEIINWVEGK